MSFYGLTAHFFLLSNNGKAPMIIPIITAVCVIRRASYTLIRSLQLCKVGTANIPILQVKQRRFTEEAEQKA